MKKILTSLSFKIGTIITQERDHDRLLETACQRLAEADSYTAAWILLVDKDGAPTKFVHRDQEGNTLSLPALPEQSGMMGCAQSVLAQAGVQIIKSGSEICKDCFLLAEHDGLYDAMAIRLEFDGTVYGMLNITVRREFDIDADEISLFEEIARDISFALYSMELEEKRVQAESKLRETNAMHAAMIENIGDVIAIVGADGMTKYQSPNIEKWFGWKPEDLIGTNGWDRMHPEDIERMQKKFSEILEKETTSTVEYRYKCKDGKYKWVELTAVNRINDPAINGVLLNYHDISERKQAEEKLTKNIASLQQAEVLAQLGNFERNWQTGEGYWSEGFFKLLGIDEKSEALSHKDFTQFIHPDDFERVTGHIRKTLSEHIPMNIEFRLVQVTGQTIHIHGTAENYYDQNDKPALTVGVFQDITHQIESQKELVESEKKLREAQEMAHLGFWSWDVKSGDVEWSEEAFKIFGLDPDTFTPQIDSILDLSPWPVDHHRNTELINHAVESHTPGDYEQKFLRPDKSIGHYYSTFQGKYDDNGEVVLIVDTVLDITERVRAEEALKEYSERLEEMVEERTQALQETQEQLLRQETMVILGQLVGSLSHELRNPLGVISNAVYYLKLVNPNADEQTKKYLGMIARETHLAEKIITALFDFAYPKPVNREPVSVAGLVQQVLERYPAPESVSVSCDGPDNLPQVFVDAGQIEQVLGNLVANACQAMPQGGQLTMSAKVEKETIALAVQDNGIGIPPENMTKLFEPLFSTKTIGIGLGLAVSKKLVEANDGRIEVESELGTGTTFTVYLSLYPHKNGGVK